MIRAALDALDNPGSAEFRVTGEFSRLKVDVLAADNREPGITQLPSVRVAVRLVFGERVPAFVVREDAVAFP